MAPVTNTRVLFNEVPKGKATQFYCTGSFDWHTMKDIRTKRHSKWIRPSLIWTPWSWTAEWQSRFWYSQLTHTFVAVCGNRRRKATTWVTGCLNHWVNANFVVARILSLSENRTFPYLTLRVALWAESLSRIQNFGVAVVLKSEDSSIKVGDHLYGFYRKPISTSYERLLKNLL